LRLNVGYKIKVNGIAMEKAIMLDEKDVPRGKKE